MSTKPSSLKNISLPMLVLSAGIIAVSSASILIKFAQFEVSSIVIAAYRLTIATVFLFPFVINKYIDELKNVKRREIILIVISGLFLALHFASWITSLKFTSIASSVVLVTTTPLWVALFSPLFLKEKIKTGIWFGIFFAMVGSIIVAFSSVCVLIDGVTISCPNLIDSFQGSSMIGNFLALIGAWMAAGYMIVGRKLRTHLAVTPYVFCVYGVASLILIGIVMLMKLPIIGFTPKIYVWLLLLGLVPQLIGHSSFNWALGYLPAAFVSVALMGEPIGTILLAYIIFAEIPLIGEVIGGILILTGILIVSMANRQTKDKNNKNGSKK